MHQYQVLDPERSKACRDWYQQQIILSSQDPHVERVVHLPHALPVFGFQLALREPLSDQAPERQTEGAAQVITAQVRHLQP